MCSGSCIHFNCLIANLQVAKNADAGRTDDTGKLKEYAHTYVFESDGVYPPLDKTPKSQWGISHPQLMREIIPITLLDRYKDNSAT